MGKRSRSKSRKKEEKHKSKRDRSRSRSKERQRRPAKPSKFSSGPPPGTSGQQLGQQGPGNSNPLLAGGLGGGMQPPQGQMGGIQFQALKQLEGNVLGELSQKVDIPSSLGGQPALSIGGGAGGPPILEISMGGGQSQMEKEEYCKQNNIPLNPDEQSLDQKIQLVEFEQQQLKLKSGAANLDGVLSIGTKSQNVHQSILQQAGIAVGSQSDDKLQGGTSTYAFNALNAQFPGVNPNIIATLTDTSKIKRKVYVPQNGFNYTGLIIGPQGSNQKRMEEASGCKILVRGKGSQKEGQPAQPDDNEEQHVLIVGETEAAVAKAQSEVERILFADEETRNRIRLDQLKMVAQIKNQGVGGLNSEMFGESQQQAAPGIDPSLTTPYGPPSEDAYIIPVPEDCVGLVIGKQGDTIKLLQERSGAQRVQVAMENQKSGKDMRNVFVEGSKESVEIVKQMLGEIVENQRKMKQGMQSKNSRVEYGIPHNMVGLVIGKGGETVKQINSKTGAFVILSREPEHQNQPKKILLISGSPDAIEAAKREIDTVVDNGIKYQQNKMMQQRGNNPNYPNNNYNNGGNNGGYNNNYNNRNQRGYDDQSLPQPPQRHNSRMDRDNDRYNEDRYNNNQYNQPQDDFQQFQQPPQQMPPPQMPQQPGFDQFQQQPPAQPQQSEDQQQQQQAEGQQGADQQAPPGMPPMQNPGFMMPPQQGMFPNPMMMNTQQLLMNAIEGPQIEEIGEDEAGDFEKKKRRRRKKNE